jgi:hypothetical protein
MTPLMKYTPLILQGNFISYVTADSENDTESEIFHFFDTNNEIFWGEIEPTLSTLNRRSENL